MKKKIYLVLIITIIFSMSACSEKNNVEESDKGNKSSEVSSNETYSEKNDSSDDEKQGLNEIPAKELLKNVHARRAIALGFNKEKICENIMFSSGNAINYIVPHGLSKNTEDLDFRSKYPEGFLEYNPEKAKEEWETAKKELGFKNVKLEILTFNADETRDMVDSMRSDLVENLDGISIEINQQPFEQKSELSKAGKFMLEFNGWSPDYPDAMAFLEIFTNNSGHNTAKYNNEKYENLIKIAKDSNDYNKRLNNLQEAEKILIEDAGVIPIYQSKSLFLIRPYIKGVNKHSFGPEFSIKSMTTDKSIDGKKIIKLLGSADYAILDVNKSTDQNSLEILANINEGLLALDENEKPVPAIASSWEVDETNTVYTFNLRDCYWSNAEAITAKDFVDSWRRLANPETASQYALLLSSARIKNAEKIIAGEMDIKELGITAIDEKTLKVELEQANPFFLELMAFPSFYPINQKFINEKGENYGTSIENSIFNGPYVMTSWDLGYGFSIRKNPNYWDTENVLNDGADFRTSKDIDTAVAMYDNHEVDICPLSGDYVEQRKDSPDFVSHEGNAVFYLNINMNLNQ